MKVLGVNFFLKHSVYTNLHYRLIIILTVFVIDIYCWLIQPFGFLAAIESAMKLSVSEH